MKYTVTYQKVITDIIEARDLNHAARIACAVVLAQPKGSVKILSIIQEPLVQLPAAEVTV